MPTTTALNYFWFLNSAASDGRGGEGRLANVARPQMEKSHCQKLCCSLQKGGAMKHLVNGVELEITGEVRAITAAGGLNGSAQIAVVKTPDQLVAEVQIKDFGPNQTMVKLTEFLSPPPPAYGHLDRNGSMTIQRLANGDWVALLRALRPGGRSWPTLNYISMDELDGLLGQNAKLWLTNLGFAVGTWEELNPAAKKFRNSIAISIPEEESHLLALPWALTRVVALMKQLGESKVVEL